MKKNAIYQESDLIMPKFSKKICQQPIQDQEYCKKSQNSPRFNWTQEQNLSYYRFMEKNIQMFECYKKRRQNKVFCLLGKNIKSRSINQIKSHHQKMLKKNKTIENILKFLRQKHYGIIDQNQSSNSDLGLKDLRIEEKQTTQIFEQSVKPQHIQLQLGIANNFPYQITAEKDEWFGDV